MIFYLLQNSGIDKIKVAIAAKGFYKTFKIDFTMTVLIL